VPTTPSPLDELPLTPGPETEMPVTPVPEPLALPVMDRAAELVLVLLILKQPFVAVVLQELLSGNAIACACPTVTSVTAPTKVVANRMRTIFIAYLHPVRCGFHVNAVCAP
jgi:hypothetical protein